MPNFKQSEALGHAIPPEYIVRASQTSDPTTLSDTKSEVQELIKKVEKLIELLEVPASIIITGSEAIKIFRSITEVK